MTPMQHGGASPALCRTYTTEADAHAAVRRILAGGVPESAIRVLTGERVRDAGRTAVGGFAGHADVVGAFAGAPHAAADTMGRFAGGAAPHRRGAFGDRDRDVVTTLAGGVERVRVASHRALRDLLVDAGIAPEAADADVEALHRGRVILLVTGARHGAAARRALDA
jgi:hypothetical protein